MLGTYIINISTTIILLIFFDYGLPALFYGELIGSLYFFTISLCFIYKYFTFDIKNGLCNKGCTNYRFSIIAQEYIFFGPRNVNKFVLQMYLPITDVGIFQRSGFYMVCSMFFIGIANTVSSKNLKNLTEKKKTDMLSTNIVHQALYLLKCIDNYYNIIS